MGKRIAAILLALCMALTLLPVTALADDTAASITVTSEAELRNALAESGIDTIRIQGEISYYGALRTDKKLLIPDGAKLVLKGSASASPLEIESGGTFAISTTMGSSTVRTISGTVINNGSVAVSGDGNCIWIARTSGSGSFLSETKGKTRVDYGCVPEDMLKDSGCQISITADPAVRPAVSLPSDMQTGQTITPDVTGLIDGVDIAKVFTFQWKNASSQTIYNGAVSPELTQAGTLKLTLTVKDPYVMRSSSGTYGSSISASGTVRQASVDTVYVDAVSGSDTNSGSANQPVQSIRIALEKVAAGGTIVLLNDYTKGDAIFRKSVTVKSAEGHRYKLSPAAANTPIYLYDGIAPTFDSVDLTNAKFTPGQTGSGGLFLTNCTGANVTIASGVVNELTVTNSQLSGTFYASEKLTLNDSTITGRFVTKAFAATGNNTFVQTAKNSPAQITGGITVSKPVALTPAAMEKNVQIVEVSEANKDAAMNSFVLKDAPEGYTLKCRNQRYLYLSVSQRVAADGGKLAVGYAPVIGANVALHNSAISSIQDGTVTVWRTTWSGYADTVNSKWSLADVPELTVTLHANQNSGVHFDGSFSPAELTIYSSTGAPAYAGDGLPEGAEILVKDGQGVGDGGETFTFTIRYPAITRLAQTITMDTAARTAHCGDVLEARQATAKTALSYESSDPAVASVDPAAGKITAHKAGTVTITVRAAQTDLYEAAEVSYSLTVSHQFGADWCCDEQSHWKECVCGEKSGAAAHSSAKKATCASRAKCDTCGQAYGGLDPDNHTDLKHFPAKKATKQAEGNIEYWYCSGCGKYYKDADATIEIDPEDIVIPRKKGGSGDPTPAEDSTGGKTVKSQNTGDMGAALYGAMALLSLTGGAWVIGKKRRS